MITINSNGIRECLSRRPLTFWQGLVYVFQREAAEMTHDFSPDTVELFFGYTNWRGETSHRRVRPISVRWGATKWHPRLGWLLLAFDLDKGEEREFSMREMLLVEPDHVFKLSTGVAQSMPPTEFRIETLKRAFAFIERNEVKYGDKVAHTDAGELVRDLVLLLTSVSSTQCGKT